MKTCVNCGVQLEDKDRFCPRCGTRCESAREDRDPYHQSYDYAADMQPASPDPTAGSDSKPASPADQYPMKWHKFLMVMLIIGAIVTIISGAILVAGGTYESRGVRAAQIYSVFPALKSCDMFYSVILIALGVFRIIVRNRLNQFRANGPFSLKIQYCLSIGAGLVYTLWASAATGMNMFTASNFISLASGAVFLMINSAYYKKRSSLFVN